MQDNKQNNRNLGNVLMNNKKPQQINHSQSIKSLHPTITKTNRVSFKQFQQNIQSHMNHLKDKKKAEKQMFKRTGNFLKQNIQQGQGSQQWKNKQNQSNQEQLFINLESINPKNKKTNNKLISKQTSKKNLHPSHKSSCSNLQKSRKPSSQQQYQTFKKLSPNPPYPKNAFKNLLDKSTNKIQSCFVSPKASNSMFFDINKLIHQSGNVCTVKQIQLNKENNIKKPMINMIQSKVIKYSPLPLCQKKPNSSHQYPNMYKYLHQLNSTLKNHHQHKIQSQQQSHLNLQNYYKQRLYQLNCTKINLLKSINCINTIQQNKNKNIITDEQQKKVVYYQQQGNQQQQGEQQQDKKHENQFVNSKKIIQQLVKLIENYQNDLIVVVKELNKKDQQDQKIKRRQEEDCFVNNSNQFQIKNDSANMKSTKNYKNLEIKINDFDDEILVQESQEFDAGQNDEVNHIYKEQTINSQKMIKSDHQFKYSLQSKKQTQITHHGDSPFSRPQLQQTSNKKKIKLRKMSHSSIPRPQLFLQFIDGQQKKQRNPLHQSTLSSEFLINPFLNHHDHATTDKPPSIERKKPVQKTISLNKNINKLSQKNKTQGEIQKIISQKLAHQQLKSLIPKQTPFTNNNGSEIHKHKKVKITKPVKNISHNQQPESNSSSNQNYNQNYKNKQQNLLLLKSYGQFQFSAAEQENMTQNHNESIICLQYLDNYLDMGGSSIKKDNNINQNDIKYRIPRTNQLFHNE